MFTLNDEDALDLLVERVNYWTNDSEVVDLYAQMY